MEEVIFLNPTRAPKATRYVFTATPAPNAGVSVWSTSKCLCSSTANPCCGLAQLVAPQLLEGERKKKREKKSDEEAAAVEEGGE